MKRFAGLALVLTLAAVPVLAQNPPAQPPAQAGQAQPQRPAQPPLGPTEWRIDPSHSAANFSVRHNVVSTVRAQLGRMTGTVHYDGTDVTSIRADVAIDVKGIHTQNQNRDDHLRTNDFFDVENHPAMTFVSKRVEPGTNGGFKLVGDLTIRGNTREVVLEAEPPAPIVKTARDVRTGTSATTKISRKEYGILWNRMIETLPVVGDEISITIDIQLIRPEPPAGAGENRSRHSVESRL
jgi:polyisoprenoid-binding protein YceI